MHAPTGAWIALPFPCTSFSAHVSVIHIHLHTHHRHASPAFGWGEKTHEVTDVVDARCDNFFSAIFGAAPVLLTLEAKHTTKYVSGKVRYKPKCDVQV
jgi:hypothetical protein